MFVAEEGGEIKVFDSVSDTTLSAFGTGLAPAVHDFWDRGLLGLAIDRSSPPGPMSMSCTPMTMCSGPATRHPAGAMAVRISLAPPSRAVWSVAGCPG